MSPQTVIFDQDKHNPFIPVSCNTNIVTVTVHFIIGLIKLPLFIILFSLSFLYYVIALMIPVPRIRKFINSTIVFILFRVMLLLTGYWSINQQPTPLVDTFVEPGEVNHPNPGDIIIANFSSYLNLFWLQSQYSPIFVIPVDANKMIRKNFYSLFLDIMAGDPVTKGKKTDLNKIISDARKYLVPVVIFPEQRVENGLGIIEFQEFGIGNDITDIHIHIFGFTHHFWDISPNFVTGIGFIHLVHMLGRIFCSMKIKIAMPQDVPAIKENIDKKWIISTREVLATILRVPMINYPKKHNE